MDGYSRLLGTTEESFQIGLNGPKIVAVGTKLRVRNETDSALARIGVDFPSDGEDAVPLDFLNSAIIDLVPTARLINTQDGIQGGGSLLADLTLSLDVNSLTTIILPDTAADYVLVYDASAGAHRSG